jgi:hypothetical protein
MALTIWRIELSRPPGVFMRRIISPAVSGLAVRNSCTM